MAHLTKAICYILLSLLFQISLNQQINIYEISELFDKLEKVMIHENEIKDLISNLTQILERYVYIDISKYPPQPDGKDNYHNAVDLIKELNETNTDERPLYDFYRELKLIISKCQDLHLSINLKKEFEAGLSFLNTVVVAPYLFEIEGGKVYSIAVNENVFSQTQKDMDMINSLKSIEGTPIESINGETPLEYIRNFNAGHRRLKSPQSQFVLNQRIISMIELINFPFEKSHLTNIKIKYDGGLELNTYYKAINVNDATKTESFLSQYFILPKKHEPFNLNMPLPRNFLFKAKRQVNRRLDEIKWDREIEDGQLKCRVDEQNKVNVIYQSSFYPSDIEGGAKFFEKCFESFYKNDYKIIVIEQFNGGGYVVLADLFKELLNLHQPSIDYMSFRYNNDVKNYIAKALSYKEVETCKMKRGDKIFNSDYVEDYYGINELGDKIKHRRTKIFDFSLLPENDYIKFKKNQNIRKPHEIIIFTDGFSYSATSIFIKSIQLDGGAIIVGYSGDPNENEFDSSQSPTPVFSTEGAQDKLSKNIEKLGFTLGYPMMELFNRLDIENDTDINYPLEYQINPIDERAQIFNSYDDSIYQEFIDEGLKIFEKYETECNPNNKHLLFLSEKCTFNDTRMHGGFQCDDKGKWSEICVPSYCDSGYYFDRINQKCIENLCITNGDDKNKTYLVLFIIFGCLFGLFLIIYVIVTIIGGFERKNYLFIPIALFLILFATFLLLYLIS